MSNQPAPSARDAGQWVSMEKAARMLGTSRYHVQRRTAMGEFRTHVVEVLGRILLSREDVEAAKTS